jgi:two-component system sensor histidine kinase ChiS
MFQRLFILLFFVIVFFNCKLQNLVPDSNSPRAFAGEIFIEESNFEKSFKVKLDGEWDFYWNTFLSENPDEKIPAPHSFAPVPGLWTDLSISEKKLPSYGFATYRLKVNLSNPPSTLGLKIVDASSSYRVFWNQKLVASAGIPAKSKESYSPSYQASLVEIKNIEKENELFLEIANFDHHKAGPWESLELGIWEKIQWESEKEILLQMFIFGGLFLIGLYHLSLFLHLKEDYTGLLFGLFCLFTSLLMLLIENKIILIFFPSLGWQFFLRLIYLSTYFAGLFYSQFVKNIYPSQVNEHFINIFTFIIILFIFSVFIFPVYYFTYTLFPFAILFILTLAYFSKIYVASLIKGREPGLIGVVSYIILFFCIVNDLLHVNLIINTFYSLKFGLILFIFTHSYILSKRYSRFYRHVQKLLSLVRRNNKKLSLIKRNLEKTVIDRTSELHKVKSRVESIGKMTSEIVHDLKNLISSILGFAELANDDYIGKNRQMEYLEIIHKEAHRLSNMSQSILDFVKGLSSFHFEKVNLENFVLQFCHSFQIEIKNKNIHLETHLEKNIFIELDVEKIRRVLLNICKYALEALLTHPKGNHTIQIYTFSKQGRACVQITDNGPGIPMEIRDHLFVPFGTFKKENGIGLGMLLAKEIVESHKGKLYFSTEIGKGTTFTMELPLLQEVSNV